VQVLKEAKIAATPKLNKGVEEGEEWQSPRAKEQLEPPQLRNIPEESSKPKPKSRTRTLLSIVVGGGLVALVVAFNDDAQHIARAAQRTGRVVGTLAVCINE